MDGRHPIVDMIVDGTSIGMAISLVCDLGLLGQTIPSRFCLWNSVSFGVSIGVILLDNRLA